MDDALNWLETAPEPWFMYLPFNAPHAPVQAPPANLTTIPNIGVGSTEIEKFNASVEAIDTELARLLDGIDPDVLASTTVIFLGDNGTADFATLPPYDPARSKGSMYDGGIAVPFIVTGPFVTQPGSVSQTMVSGIDVWNTIADIAEVDHSTVPDLDFDGISLLPWIVDPAAPATRDIIYNEHTATQGGPPYTNHMRAVRDARWRLSIEEPGGIRMGALFDYESSDLDEGAAILEADLNAEQQEAWDRLWAYIDEVEARTPYTPQD